MTSGLWLRPDASGTLDQAVNRRVQGLAAWLQANQPEGVSDAVPGYGSLYVEFDSRVISAGRLLQLLEEVEPAGSEARLVEVPVDYDGPDLARALEATGLDRQELIARHTAASYHVFSTSFSPGMPLAGSLEPVLQLPRLGEPRKRVPAGSVAVAGAQTGVYALPGPGGWNLLGSALVNLFDPHRSDPFLVRPLDRIRFTERQGARPALPEPLELLPAEPRHPRLRVLKPGMLDLIVDRGRPWGGLHGLAQGGPADPLAAAIAGALVGNHPAAALLEMNLTGPVLEARCTMVVAVTGEALQPLVRGQPLPGWSSLRLQEGDRLEFRPTGNGARSYLALAGGIETERFLGSRSTDVGGLLGRPLRAGDTLGAASEAWALPGRSFRGHSFTAPGRQVLLRLVPGPQYSPEAAEALERQLFTVESADRMGVRLAGAQVPGFEVVSEAVPLGSVQVTASGLPMILLNDRGRVGGYSKPAVLDRASLSMAGQLLPGDRLRFRFRSQKRAGSWYDGSNSTIKPG